MALYSLETYGELEPFAHQEWLLTNGLGGYASSTVVGCNTRRYHGLLVSATLPPVGRINTLERLGELLILDDDVEHPIELSVNQFRDNIHPRGYQYLRKFEFDDTARWEYETAGWRITKELQVPGMRNIAGIRYTIQGPPGKPMELRLLPFVALRDFHATRHANGYDLPTDVQERTLSVKSDEHTLHIESDAGRFVGDSKWWYGHVYAIETERGLDDSEGLFNPGYLSVPVTGEATVTLWLGLDPKLQFDWEGEIQRRRGAVDSACHVPRPDFTQAQKASDLVLRKLTRAANDFVVYRKAPDGTDGTTVIAGYPWFSDWGRDTMIAFPGLFLVPRRIEQARQVLSVFASYVSEGMIPNRFNDYTNEPEYNTVDASLWFIHACFEYARVSEDRATFERILRPACQQIIDGYRRGTRYGIKMDERDGLVAQGDENTQLTWMDAKCGDIAFTPRQGKPVEINALWYHALVLMGVTDLASKVANSFKHAFWISPFRGLADVVQDDPEAKPTPSGVGYRRDPALRPNQIFAASLANSPLLAEQQHAVVEVVRRELLTPVGLRSLARADARYHPRYFGTQMRRDEAYHNGTVWAWLIGHFLDAYLRVHDSSPDAIAQARRWLSPLIDQMDGACLGQIAEIFEADEPHRPVGCCAQAWSVAEVLRCAVYASRHRALASSSATTSPSSARSLS
jgi:predicted glycogen debranching enzyme